MNNQVERQHSDGEPRKWFLTRSRTQFYLFLLGSFLLPPLALTSYAAEMPGIFVIGLASLLASGLGGWYLLSMWEQKMQRSVSKIVQMRLARVQLPPAHEEVNRLHGVLLEARRGYEHQIDLLQSSVAKSKEEVRHLNLEMDKKLEEMRLAYLEFEDLRKEYHRLEVEFAHAQEESQKALLHKESLNNEYQRTITEQRLILEKKQSYINTLEGKVHDLMYEIRSLLQLEDTSPETATPSSDFELPLSYSATKPYDLSLHLERCIEKAESQMGMDHLGGRFLDLSDSYAVDRRPFFDSFRDEVEGIVFVLSLTENKFIFVNQHVKTVLGWSPERFMKTFPNLVVSGYRKWREVLKTLRPGQEGRSPLVVQGKGGEQKELMCIMGMVSKGPFTNHIIGILS